MDIAGNCPQHHIWKCKECQENLPKDSHMRNPAFHNDIGHDNLICDLNELLAYALKKEFHDFANSKFVAPKIALVETLEAIIQSAKSGRYDN